MIDERTKSVCKSKKIEPPPFSMKEHVEFMQSCNRSMWKSFLKNLKDKK